MIVTYLCIKRVVISNDTEQRPEDDRRYLREEHRGVQRHHQRSSVLLSRAR